LDTAFNAGDFTGERVELEAFIAAGTVISSFLTGKAIEAAFGAFSVLYKEAFVASGAWVIAACAGGKAVCSAFVVYEL